MELHCPKCNSLSITNLANKIEDDNDFALLFLKWIIKISGKSLGCIFCSMFFVLILGIKNLPIFGAILVTCFIISLLINTCSETILNIYKMLIYSKYIEECMTENKKNKESPRFHWDIIFIVFLNNIFIGVIIFYCIPVIILGIFHNILPYDIDSEKFISSGVIFFILCNIGLFIMYQIIKTRIENFFICNNCNFVFDSNYTLEDTKKWFKKEADKGNEEAKEALKGLEGKSDYKYALWFYKNGYYIEAFNYFLKLAETGNTEAQYNLGVMYENGEGVEKDIKEAKNWYKKASDQGDKDAKKALKKLEENDEDKDDIEAFNYFLKLAETGNTEAQYNLGVMYENGEGVEKDIKEAKNWYKKASDKGDEDAKEALKELEENENEE